MKDSTQHNTSYLLATRL